MILITDNFKKEEQAHVNCFSVFLHNLAYYSSKSLFLKPNFGHFSVRSTRYSRVSRIKNRFLDLTYFFYQLFSQKLSVSVLLKWFLICETLL